MLLFRGRLPEGNLMLSELFQRFTDKIGEIEASAERQRFLRGNSVYGQISDADMGFRGRAKRCAMGDLASMLWMHEELRRRLSERYRELEIVYMQEPSEENWRRLRNVMNSNEDDQFYITGAHMWLQRAALYGSEKAMERMEKYSFYNPISFFRLKFQVPGNALSGGGEGVNLNKIGLLDFMPRATYGIDSLSAGRYYTGSVYMSYEGWDETGFGAEDEDDYFFYDEFFCLLFGLKNRSSRDIRNNLESISSQCQEKIQERQNQREDFWKRNKGVSGMERYHRLADANGFMI